MALVAACGDDARPAVFDTGSHAGVDAARGAMPRPDATADAAMPVVMRDVTPDAGASDATLVIDENDGGPEPDASATMTPDGPRERVMLVDHTRWTLLAGARDPFADAPAGAAPCDATLHAGSGFGYESFAGEHAFFVSTARCDYLTAEQPALLAVRAGDLVKVRLWHFELTAPEGTEAHIVVRLGEETVFEDRVPIPLSSELLTARWTAPADIPAGTPVRFHLHNHGANEYALIELSTGPQE